MTLEVYLSPPDQTVDAGFPKLRKAAEWVMWVLPTGPSLDRGDALLLLSAFQDLRCVAWFASDGGGHTPAIKNHLRSFGQFADAAKNVVVQRTLKSLALNKTIYSDIAWFDSEHSESLASFLYRSTAGRDSTISFIPDNERSVEEWSRAVTGLEWLWLLDNTNLTAPDTPLDPDPVIAAYVQLTIRLNGVAALVCDIEGKRGLTFFGERRILEAAADQIIDGGQQVTKKRFEQLLYRGLHFRAAP